MERNEIWRSESSVVYFAVAFITTTANLNEVLLKRVARFETNYEPLVNELVR